MKQLALRATILGGFGLALVILLVLSSVTYRNIRLALDNSRWVAHTQEVVATTEACLSLLKDAETGQQGYLITDSERYLEPYQAARAELPQRLTRLRVLTVDNPSQQHHLATVEPLITQKLAELQETIDFRTSQGFAAAQAVVLTDQGKQTMDAIRAIGRDIESEEQTLLQRREAATEASSTKTIMALVVGDVFAFVLVGFAGFAVSRELRRRQQVERDLMRLNSTLEQQIADRTTALQQAHAAERAQREYFQTTLVSIGDAVIVTDADGIVTFLNKVAEKVIGWTTAEATGKPLPEVFRIENEETRQAVENPVAKVLRTGEVTGLANHTILIRKDGNVCPIDDSAAPIRDEQGRVLGVILVFRDITARKQAEDALRESEQRWHTLAEALPALVWMARPDGFLDYYNHRWYDYTGLSESQLAGWGWEAVWHPEDLSEGRTRWREALRTGQPYEYEARLRRATDASYRWHLIRSVPLRNEKEQVLRWFGTNVDIEEQKHTAVELQRVNEELQQFSHIVSHDLNEPLRTMSNFVTLLARRYQGKLDATADEYISFVTDGAQRMQQMISDLLAYTRVGGPAEVFTAVDMEVLLARVLSELQMVIAEATAEVTHDLLPTVQGDETRLGQVFHNLIGNGLKFRGQAPPRIHISAVKEDRHWRFSVRDNGIGIDPQQAKRLFHVFQRLHTRSEYPGTGIGLAICKKIVERHGGRIWVESQPGKGAIFYFTISDIRRDNPLIEQDS